MPPTPRGKRCSVGPTLPSSWPRTQAAIASWRREPPRDNRDLALRARLCLVDDLYKRLQVDPQAETEVVRAAYYALARKYHPDAGGDGRRMVEFNAAWAVLGDPSLRSVYDADRDRPSAPTVNVERPGPLVHNGYGRSDGLPRSKSDPSTILDFGRYAGCSLAQLAKGDPSYLEWLVRTSIGRRFSAEVKALLEVRATSFNEVEKG